MATPPKYSAKIPRRNTLFMKSASTEIQEDHVITEDIIKHIYPSHINPVSSEVALDLVEHLLEPGNFSGIPRKELIKHLSEEKGHSKSTIQNKVIPMLKKRGLIKSSRDRGVFVTREFSKSLKEIAECWETIFKRQKKLDKRKGEED